jgi:Lar family restriction alleviation protein
MLRNKLKPCPFCGSKNIDLLDDQDMVYYGYAYYAKCRQCKAQSRSEQKKEDAIAAWNEREGGKE